MKTPRSQIAPVVADLILRPDADAKQLSQEIAAYLLDENRTNELDSLMRDIIACRADKGTVEITAVSAHALPQGVEQDIEKLVREHFPGVKEIIINERIDADAVGGVRLELVGQQLDMTIRSKLNRFKELTAVERTAA
jgi:F0F1-type ATP synthase delta subunit